MGEIREGLLSTNIGTYVGSTYDNSNPLSQDDMDWNAFYIWDVLYNNFGWSENAIGAILGNMHAESTINAGRWQSDDVGNLSGGYSLVQWTPATKYISWVENAGITDDPSEMDNALLRINYEVQAGIQWIATAQYNFSFEDFTTSTEEAGTLAKAFLLNYERPADQSESVQNYRAKLAEYYYALVSGGDVPDLPDYPTPDNPTKEKNKFNFIFYNSIKRRNEAVWKNRNFYRR